MPWLVLLERLLFFGKAFGKDLGVGLDWVLLGHFTRRELCAFGLVKELAGLGVWVPWST